jgi:4-diphosphocytidyl-2C-methyl-D-erythritol kinase
MLSPAKLNLSLRVLSKRPDGFHEIETLMVKLPGLADEITILPSDQFSFTCSDPSLPTDSRNLAVKAVEALAEKTGHPQHYQIHLEKRIPHGAGLGGGSSNAATVLLALNSQLANPLSPQELHELAATIGSDVPFFLYAGAAWCRGRGEIIEAAPAPPALPIVLFKPGFSVSTADAYHNCLEAEPLPGIRYDPYTCFYQTSLPRRIQRLVAKPPRYKNRSNDRFRINHDRHPPAQRSGGQSNLHRSQIFRCESVDVERDAVKACFFQPSVLSVSFCKKISSQKVTKETKELRA